MNALPHADPPRGSVWVGARAPDNYTGPQSWPLPERVLYHLVLDTRRATLVYWGAVALVVGGLFITKLLPCVDYPQHLALSDVARRLSDPAAPEHVQYELNYFTYNGLFHVVVAWLSRLVPIELAGRLVVSASLAGLAGAVVALVRVLRRPPIHAALFMPILFSFALGWGFVNYVLATAIAAWALVFVVRAVVRPTLSGVAAVGVLGLVCAFAHVLAMMILCIAAAGLALELGWRVAPRTGTAWARAGRALLRATVAALPLVLGCIYCVAVYRRQYAWDPHMYKDPTLEGTAPPLWQKVFYFGAFATDLFWDASDQVVLWLSLLIMGWSEWLSWKRRRAQAGAGRTRPRLALQLVGEPAQEQPPATLSLFATMTVAYFATPMVMVGTHLIFPRLAQWAVLGALLAVPRFAPPEEARARRWTLGLAALAGLNVFGHCALYAWETNDASRVIDDLPPGGAATAVIWNPGTWAFRNGTLTHLAAYYAARKHGAWGFAFARYLSVPVRFRPGAQPAWPAHGWEFSAEQYDPRCKYARAFPLVVVRAPKAVPTDASGERRLREIVFRQDAKAPRLLSHHGRFWAFDTTGLPEDGTF